MRECDDSTNILGITKSFLSEGEIVAYGDDDGMLKRRADSAQTLVSRLGTIFSIFFFFSKSASVISLKSALAVLYFFILTISEALSKVGMPLCSAMGC